MTATEVEARRHRDDFAPAEACVDTAPAGNAGRQADAEHKSFALLKSWLSPEQLFQFERMAYFEVVGSKTGKRYRVVCGASQNVYELDKRGRRVRGWCFVPKCFLPTGDVMLAQKIALETDEGGAMKVALPFRGNAGPGSVLRWVIDDVSRAFSFLSKVGFRTVTPSGLRPRERSWWNFRRSAANAKGLGGPTALVTGVFGDPKGRAHSSVLVPLPKSENRHLQEASRDP